MVNWTSCATFAFARLQLGEFVTRPFVATGLLGRVRFAKKRSRLAFWARTTRSVDHELGLVLASDREYLLSMA